MTDEVKNIPNMTLAQRLYVALGVDSFRLFREHGKNPSFTKKGPVRKHQQGKRSVKV